VTESLTRPYDHTPWVRPHRGTAILVLGILGLVICAPLGIVAWVMGNNDLNEMATGAMDREGEGLTRAGQICGMIATILLIIQCLLACLWITFVVTMIGARA